MSLAQINEQLLRSLGAGIVLADAGTLAIRFHNDAVTAWLGEIADGAVLTEVMPELDVEAMRAALAEGQPYAVEMKVKPKRRTLAVACTFSKAMVDSRMLIVIECQNITRMRELESMIESYSSMVERNTRELEREKERAERLLLNIMPRQVYEEYKSFGVVTPQLYPDVTVMMLDFVGFTRKVEEMDPTVTVSELNDIFTSFDRIAEQYGAERIKTAGDAYMAVAGLPEPAPDHARIVANCAIRFLRYIERRNQSHPHKWDCRIGIASGPVVGSVVGIQKYVYDIFGPAVNLASRLQALAEPNQIVAHDKLKGALIEEFSLADLGMREVRSFGELRLMSVSPATQRVPGRSGPLF